MTSLNKKQRFFKRMFDVLVTLTIIPIIIIPLLVFVFVSSISTKQSGIFIQQRIGENGVPFKLFKIRTLKGSKHTGIIDIKEQETLFGKWLRKSKLDELPQLFNVLFGTMSLVGPRPDVPGYADLLKGEDRIIVSIKPGVTGPATIKYKNEDELLLWQENPNKYNDEIIWPDKVSINKKYILNWSLLKDIKYLWISVFG